MTTKGLVIKKASKKDHVAWLTLNRPEKKNALSVEMMDQLIGHLNEISEDRDMRVIVLSAAGDSFCSGLDLHDHRKTRSQERLWGRNNGSQEIVRLLRMAPQITIAAVQGYCLGGGFVLLNACDLAIAAEDAQIGLPEILRCSYGAVATPTLFHTGVPNKVAFYLQLTGRNINGLEAARLGLATKAARSQDLMKVTEELALEIAQRHRMALAHAKIAAYTEMELPLHQALLADEAIMHRMRYYMDPLNDVEQYLKSQKGGGNVGYRKPDAE